MKSKLFINLILASAFFTQFHIKEALSNTTKSEPVLKTENSDNFKDTYLLGIGDTLDIKFFGAEEFTDVYEILPDGNLNLPIVGGIYIENLSIPKATSLIEKNSQKS